MDDREYELEVRRIDLKARELDIREREHKLAESTLAFEVRQYSDRMTLLDEAKESLDSLRDLAAAVHADHDHDDDPHPVFSRGSRGQA
jgi:hypothetical protein